MPRARRAGANALAVVVAALVLTGCATGASAPSDAGPEAVDGTFRGLSVEVRQGRFDVPDRVLVVSFANDGEERLVIDRAEVVSPALEPGMTRSRPIELDPGDRLDARFPLTASVCDAAPDTTVDVLVRRGPDVDADDGVRAALVPSDPYDTMARINDRDCLADSVAAAASIVLPDRLRTTGEGTDARAVIDVGVEPAASGDLALEITQVLGTTLIGSEAGGAWPVGLDVAAGDPATTVELPVRPARCDAHAIADDKRGTILPFEVRTSDGRSGVLELPSGDALKADLYAYYAERCGLD
ncbi:hypothetical protein [Agromyces sp. C10]|uniref:hypothetical protein n=1 Tax=Agromyces sp. C10 TaxID=2935077 RepID=UPI00200A7F3B|nr:hypothetical protein [Agromyces sp. C10]MCK8608959.1 hypothetical protein [Agromyces sp. C10]